MGRQMWAVGRPSWNTRRTRQDTPGLIPGLFVPNPSFLPSYEPDSFTETAAGFLQNPFCFKELICRFGGLSAMCAQALKARRRKSNLQTLPVL